MICKNCGSERFRKCETNVLRSGETKTRYRCRECGRSHTISETVKSVTKTNKFVITSCQNDTSINENFYNSLQVFCEETGSTLQVFKTTFLTPENISNPPVWHVEDEHLVDYSVDLEDRVRVLANIKVAITSLNPLAGIDDLSRGKHIIVAHPQLQMKTLLTDTPENPIFAYTTGTVSVPNYSYSKAGIKAKQNHSYSALYVEIGDVVHIRVLNGDKDGNFYDVTGFYTPDGKQLFDHVEALITGDEHAMFISPKVLGATYTNPDSMVNVLKPKHLVRHDVLDFYSGSHHHESNVLLKYEKRINKTDDVKKELDLTCDHILKTTPEWATSVIVSSNHNDHLTKWLNFYDPKQDITNAKIYYGIMYTMCDMIDKGMPITPFEAYFRMQHKEGSVVFLGRNEPCEIKGVVISQHGDVGGNGSRGSAMQFARTAKKYVIGHSHSPRIEKGTYQVGTSTSRLEYAKGLTTWANTHCVIYPNGTRQLLTIQDGKWC
jgi:hypothetical protein